MTDSTTDMGRFARTLGCTDDVRRRASSAGPAPGSALGRIVRIDRASALVVRTDSVESTTRSGLSLAVGDWVWLDEKGEVANRLERANEVVRVRGDGTPQLLGVNVDVTLLVVDVRNAHRVGLIERLSTVGWDTQTLPHFVVTKCDLASAQRRAEIEAAITLTAPGIDASFVSATSNLGRDDLAAVLSNGRTGMLIGHSGVGKSTLLNWLLEDARADVGAVRERDSKGRHTTTARTLYPLAGIGGSVIDTPGIREIGIASVDSLEQLFGDIWDVSAECRFSDCRHTRDAGCALRDAVERGDIPVDRYRRFLAYLKELDAGPSQRRDKSVEYSRMAREFRKVRGH